MSIQGKFTLVKRWIGILTGNSLVAVDQGIGKHFDKNRISGYYNDLTGKVNDKALLDEVGVPINIIEGNQKVYFPISIFQYALGLWDLYLDSNSIEYRNNFMMISEWILLNQFEDGSWNCFEPIGYKEFTVSSMGQGEAISVMARAYTLTKDKKWIYAMEKAVKFMLKEVKDGGTLLINDNSYVLEEYPSIKGEKRSVLNGWIFSIFGLYDYLLLNNDEYIKDIFEKSVQTLIYHINDYDNGYWSLYDMTGRISSPAYHKLHIALLLAMYKLTDEIKFKEVAIKWEKYGDKKVNRYRAILKKALQKLGESPEGIIIQ